MQALRRVDQLVHPTRASERWGCIWQHAPRAKPLDRAGRYRGLFESGGAILGCFYAADSPYVGVRALRRRWHRICATCRSERIKVVLSAALAVCSCVLSPVDWSDLSRSVKEHHRACSPSPRSAARRLPLNPADSNWSSNLQTIRRLPASN